MQNIVRAQVQYKETQPLYFVGVILILVMLPIYLIDTDSGENNFWAGIFAAILPLIIIILFYKFEITVTSTIIKLSFGIGLLKKEVDVKDIINITSHKIPFYTGIGIRILGNNTMQYNGRIGKAVKLTLGNSKSYVISTKNPDELMDVLNRLKNHR